MNDIISVMESRDNKKAFELLSRLLVLSQKSNELYTLIDEFVSLLSAASSFVRIRGFRLICAQAKWDTCGKLNGHIEALMAALHDDKPAAVRQYLSALKEMVPFKPELCGRIEKELDALDLSVYKDSMIPLLLKDIGALRREMERMK